MWRLIPAHAGKTGRRLPTDMWAAAHPRSRGENGTRSDLAYVTEGSSPLTRGKHEEGGRGGPEAGLIPAHAGKTGNLGSMLYQAGAHPRSRGENRNGCVAT